MAVSLNVYRGSAFEREDSEIIYNIPVCVQKVYRDYWEKAIEAGKGKVFRVGSRFTHEEISAAMEELECIHGWALENDGEESVAMAERAMEIFDRLEELQTEIKVSPEDFWLEVE